MSIKSILLSLIVFQGLISFSQEVENLPKGADDNVESLSNYLCEGINDTEKQVEAIYTWITSNIEFDYTYFENNKPRFVSDPNETLKSRKGLSGEYSRLMQEMLKVQLIPSEMVKGYGRPIQEDSIIFPVNSDHIWIAINIDNQWKLADPALDAGYVGYEKTNKEEKFEKAWAKHNAKYDQKLRKLQLLENSDREDEFKDLVKQRELKTQSQRIQAALALSEKEDKTPDFKDKMTFYQEPSKKFFLTHPDTFVLDHMPAHPMWQLKSDTMGLLTFLQGKKAMTEHLTKNKVGANYPYKSKITEFALMNGFDQLAYEAVGGHEFNTHNYKIVAQNHFLILKSIFENPEFDIRLIKKDNVEFNRMALKAIMDTTLKYNTLSSKKDKEYFKFLSSYYKDLYKEGKGIDNHQNRMVSKAAGWNVKAITKIERSWGHIERDFAKWLKIRDKIYPNIDITYSLDSMNLKDFDVIPMHHQDSLKKLYHSINEQRSIWQNQRKNSSLSTIIDLQNDENYVLQYSSNFLKMKNYANNDVYDSLNVLFQTYHERVERLYADSLMNEMYNKEYIESMDAFYKYVQMVNTELSTQTNLNSTVRYKPAIGVLWGYVLIQVKSLLVDLGEANQHHWWLEAELGNINKFWEKMVSLSEVKISLQEEKNTYISDNINNMEEREDNWNELVKTEVSAWKVKMSGSR